MNITVNGESRELDSPCTLLEYLQSQGIDPDAVVVVATVRALKMHGGLDKKELATEDIAALERGIPNLLRHVSNIKNVYKLPCVVAVNRFPTDTDAEIDFIIKKCRELGVNTVLSTVWAEGGKGGEALAREVVRLCEEEKGDFTFSYELDGTIEEKIEAIEKETEEEYAANGADAKTVQQVHEVQEDIVHNEVRRLIAEDKIRPDGRKPDELRPLDAQVDILGRRVHGSAMFTRGQTQVISTTTLGPLSDRQIIDDLTPEETKRFMHHYNFPQWCVGGTGKIGVLARREIGHGALGERALSYVIPSAEDFPYTVRVVSEVVESNGSSSQASICAGCMSLMAAGVPIKRMVSGIAMGLISTGSLETNPYTILTDIQGLEDHFGDMDFKVAGTEVGITALQMDIKIAGVTREVLREALAQAHKARAEIRAVMSKAIKAPREDVAEFAPKLDKMTIDVDKIRDVIGTGGKVINDIIAQCDNVQIDIDDDGHVVIYHMNREMINKAKEMIENIVREAKVGEVYEGEVTRVEDYGAFVKLFGNCEGLCHVSRLDWGYVAKASDKVKVGDTLKVRVCEIDDHGKVKVSHREFIEKPAGYIEKPVEKKPLKKHHK